MLKLTDRPATAQVDQLEEGPMRPKRLALIFAGFALAVGLAACDGQTEPPEIDAAPPVASVATQAVPAAADPAPVAPVAPTPTSPATTEPVAAPPAAEVDPVVPAPPVLDAPAPPPPEQPADPGPLDGIMVPDPYDPNDEASILARYQADKARLPAVLASGSPVLWVTDAIWCYLCEAVRPHVREIMDEYAGRIHVLIMDYDDSDLAGYRRDFNAANHPSLATLGANGALVRSYQGVANKAQIVEMIEAALTAS